MEVRRGRAEAHEEETCTPFNASIYDAACSAFIIPLHETVVKLPNGRSLLYQLDVHNFVESTDWVLDLKKEVLVCGKLYDVVLDLVHTQFGRVRFWMDDSNAKDNNSIFCFKSRDAYMKLLDDLLSV